MFDFLFKGDVNWISHNIYVALSIKSFIFRLLKLYWTLPVNTSFSPLVLLWSTGESPKCIFDFKGIIWVFTLLFKKLCPDKTIMADWTLKTNHLSLHLLPNTGITIMVITIMDIKNQSFVPLSPSQHRHNHRGYNHHGH